VSREHKRPPLSPLLAEHLRDRAFANPCFAPNQDQTSSRILSGSQVLAQDSQLAIAPNKDRGLACE
jgi:hypothetical protein